MNTTPKVKCDLCDQEFSSAHGMRVHRFRKHSGHNWSTTKGKVRVGRHFRSPDPQLLNEAAERAAEKLGRGMEEKTSLTKCPICHREYRNRPNLSHHIRHVHHKSIMDFDELMVGYFRRKKHYGGKRGGARQIMPTEAERKPVELPAPIRGHIDYCPRCGQNIKAFELAAGFIS